MSTVPASHPASVFQAPDQGQILDRLDAVMDDDLDSAFFGLSNHEVEQLAVETLNLGIRTLSVHAEVGGSTPFDEPAALTGSGRSVAVEWSKIPSGFFIDPGIRQAFILGGPSAVVGHLNPPANLLHHR